MISTILRKLAEYLSFFLKNKPLEKKKDEKIINEINQNLKNFKLNKRNLKKTHIRFNLQILKLFKKKKIKNFLRESFIQKMFFVHNRLFIYNELKFLQKSSKWNFYKKLLIEDNVGNPIRFFLYPISSGNKINHVFHLSVLIEEFKLDLKKIKKVFEFGGGYGCMAKIISKVNRNIKYTCFDTYLVNLLQFYYLKHNNLNVGFSKKNNFFLTSNLKKIERFKNNHSNSIFIANWSISETHIKFRKKFEDIIKKNNYVLISFQEYFENINNLTYFKSLKKKMNNRFQIKILKNQFYRGNLVKKQNHFYFLAKKNKM